MPSAAAHTFRRRPAGVVLPFLLLFLAACGEQSTVPVEPAQVEPGAALAGAPEAMPDSPLVFGEPDRRFLRLAQRAPAFAGYYLDGEVLRVRSTTGELPPGLTPATDRPIEVRPADHSWETLARWHRLVFETMAELGSWQWIDIDERRNRIVVAAEDHGAARQALEAAGVPEVQPAGSAVIGTEVFDDPGFTGGDCPDGYVCRYSDAALVEFASDVDYELGFIARTAEEGSLFIDPNEPRYIISHEAGTPVKGSSMWWQGRTTGLHTGNINKTCVARNFPDEPQAPDNLILLCQFRHSSKGDDGDSGAPVFTPPVSSSFGEEVKLAGIIWAKQGWWIFNNNSWFSPLSGIRQELNPNGFFDCDGLRTTLAGGCGSPSGSSGNCTLDGQQLLEECEP